MHSLIAAYSVAWAILLLYAIGLQSRQRQLQAELAALRTSLTPAIDRRSETPRG